MPSFDAASHGQAVWSEILSYLHRFHLAMVREAGSPACLAGRAQRRRCSPSALPPPPVQQRYLSGKCRDAFNEAAQAATGALISVNFVTGANAGGALTRFGDAYDDVILSPDYVFENFVTGPCNRLPYAALPGRGRTPRQGLQPALHSTGSCGLGKEHLLGSHVPGNPAPRY